MAWNISCGVSACATTNGSPRLHDTLAQFRAEGLLVPGGIRRARQVLARPEVFTLRHVNTPTGRQFIDAFLRTVRKRSRDERAVLTEAGWPEGRRRVA